MRLAEPVVGLVAGKNDVGSESLCSGKDGKVFGAAMVSGEAWL
jgi:hypothetical protein